MPLISNCSMMPAWHQLVPMSGHVEESETARKLQLYATSIYQVHSFVCQLDYGALHSCYCQTFVKRLPDVSCQTSEKSVAKQTLARFRSPWTNAGTVMTSFDHIMILIRGNWFWTNTPTRA